MWSEPNHGNDCNCSECRMVDSSRSSSCNGGDDIYKKEIEYLKIIIANQAKLIDNLMSMVKTNSTEQYVPKKEL